MGSFKVEYLNPEGLHKSPFYSQAAVVRGNAKTIYIGGQNAVNAQGEIVGPGDLARQVGQIVENIRTILAAESATFDDVIRLNIYLTQGCDPRVGLAAFLEAVGKLKNPPLITVLFVAGLASPAFLAEIDGVAVVEDA